MPRRLLLVFGCLGLVIQAGAFAGFMWLMAVAIAVLGG